MTSELPATEPIRMHPRTAVLLAAGFATVVLAGAMVLLPVRYAVLRPGPALNTLGKVDGKSLIAITGHATYPTSGSLDLTTVTVFGGPSHGVNLFQVLGGWLDSSVAVVPEEQVFPPGQSAQQQEKETQAEMVTSQESATAAAMRSLGITVPTTMTISDVDKDSPAASVLHEHDVIVGVNGAPTIDLVALRDVLQKVKGGATVAVLIRREGVQQTVNVRTRTAEGGRTVLGVLIDPTFNFPFQVKIQIENIGGPSAGTMFALGIIDTLTPGSLTGGRQIAGTGTMDPDGTVGPIGGIQQKLVGAREAGARWFLAPADNCNDVVGHIPDGLRVVRIGTLDEARHAVETIAKGSGTDGLPVCTRAK